jgi:hypothetical protein
MISTSYIFLFTYSLRTGQGGPIGRFCRRAAAAMDTVTLAWRVTNRMSLTPLPRSRIVATVSLGGFTTGNHHFFLSQLPSCCK